ALRFRSSPPSVRQIRANFGIGTLAGKTAGDAVMIRVRKIAHASYEMPDLERQVAYYTDILGLTLTAKEKDAAYLANGVDQHAVVLRCGPEVKCVHSGFQLGPDDDLDAFEKQTAAHGIKTARRKDPEPTISDVVTFEDPKGTVMEVFKRPEPAPQKFQR